MSKEIVWLSEQDAAAMVGLTPTWFARRVREGTLPIKFSKPSWKKRLYEKSSIEAYIASCSTLSQKETRSATRPQTVN